MTADRSEGWEDIAGTFMAVRSGIGVALVTGWAARVLAPGAAILDVGCGNGLPIGRALLDAGFMLHGVDAAPSLVAAFRQNCPGAPVVCEAAQDSGFFGRRFDAVISVGLLFLLSAPDQKRLIDRVAAALVDGGRFLFSAPRQVCDWQDSLTGRPSRSLGEAAYEKLLVAAGLDLVGCHVDEGENNYFEAVKRGA
ncbi:MAG: class I SAM-dependent methyltransferase [Alphaproteobacteria bacterium]|nr:MAG: class I SAM-dependent methyltransferase [Alphaproteobacteria bacterium]